MHKLDDGGSLRHIHAIVITLDFRLNPDRVSFAVELQRVARGGFFEAALHVFGLTVELFRAMAPRLAPQHHLVGHNIDRHTALDDAAGKAVFLDDPHDLADNGHSAFVVTAEHSAAVGA